MEKELKVGSLGVGKMDVGRGWRDRAGMEERKKVHCSTCIYV